MFLRSTVSILMFSTMLAGSTAGAEAMETKPSDVKMLHQHAAAKKTCSASTRAYEAAMMTMHKNMAAPLSGNADVDFVRQMIPHHQGAVEMAKTELRYGHDKQVLAFARWVIRAQEQEIAAMKNWLERRDNGAVVKNAPDYYGPAMTTMHHAMMIDYTGDADLDFVRGMIPHHQGALAMADVWFKNGSDPDIKTLATDIYSSQSGEIAMMHTWLAEHTTK